MAKDGWGRERDKDGRVVPEPYQQYGEFMFFLETCIQDAAKKGLSLEGRERLANAQAYFQAEFSERHPEQAKRPPMFWA